jgi:hypothetical protein
VSDRLLGVVGIAIGLFTAAAAIFFGTSEWLGASLFLAGVAILVLGAVWVVRAQPAPRIIPRFDFPWFKASHAPARDTVVAYNAGSVDALRARLQPIALAEDEYLTTDGEEVLIKARTEHGFVLRLKQGAKSVLRQTVDVPEKIWRESTYAAVQEGHIPEKRHLSVFLDFEDDKGRTYRAVWALEDDTTTSRVRFVFRNQFRTKP